MKLLRKIIIHFCLLTFLFHQTSLGQTWERLNEPPSGCDKVEILNNDIIAISHTTGVSISLDKTKTWSHTLNTYNILNFLKFDNSLFALGGADGPFIYVSDSIGTNWNNIVNSIIVEPYVTKIAIRDSNHIYALATEFGGENAHIYKTTDGGTNWVLQSIEAKDFRIFLAGEENILYGLNYNTGFYISFDEGITWENKINGITSDVFYSLAQTENGDLLISTSGGKIYYSSNNGDMWFSRTEYFADNCSLMDIEISSNGNVYVVAEDSASISVHKSTDQGITWTQVGSDLALQIGYPHGIYFGDMAISHDEKIILIVDGRLYSKDSVYTTSIEKERSINDSYYLSQNYPNPFNPSTTISYSLPHNGSVQLKVYDILGREVVTLVNKEQTRGNYKVEFNANNMPSGIYFYRLRSSDFVDTKKMLLLR